MLAYKESLKQFSAEQVDRGCREAIKRCTFIPKPADIIQAIGETAEQYPQLKGLPGPRMSAQEFREVFAEAREQLKEVLTTAVAQGGDRVVIITDEMREEAKRKAKEAAERFGKSAHN